MLKTLTIGYAGLLGAIVALANLKLLGPLLAWLHVMPLSDKACHFLLFGMLSFLVCITFSIAQPRRRLMIVISTVIALVAISSLEECSQSLFAHRRFDHIDMLSNIAGTFVFGFAALLVPMPAPTLD